MQQIIIIVFRKDEYKPVLRHLKSLGCLWVSGADMSKPVFIRDIESYIAIIVENGVCSYIAGHSFKEVEDEMKDIYPDALFCHIDDIIPKTISNERLIDFL